ncbi:hypothetical protein NLI96_g10339 [Meripilus lineatus]|uniref:F-box domain-containing protein n=1 Tax=Meripilus lineatus TaxID=2056292 RepID=A0AAD5UZ24_9APHY|nr:hypothetical protein NLI96_g10339 [Physisporinus lineatus]
MPPEIPQELVDNIIDHLHDDTPSLIVTSLVSKAWMHSSRFHLFSSIDIVDDPEGLDYIQFLETSPNVCHHVWDLYLEFRGEVMVEIITRLLTCLGNLRSFVIEGQVSRMKSRTMPFPLYHIDFLGIHFMLPGPAEVEGPEEVAEWVEEDGGEIVPADEIAPNHGGGGGIWDATEPTELMKDSPPEGVINVLRLFSLWHIGELFVTFSIGFPHCVGEADEFLQAGPSTMHVKTLGIVNDPGDGLLFRLLRHLLHPTNLRTLHGRQGGVFGVEIVSKSGVTFCDTCYRRFPMWDILIDL